MAKRQIYTLEFPVRCSPNILYNFLSTASGLQEWFADNVDERDGIMSFSWSGGAPDKAKIIAREENLCARYSWLHEDPKEYFEFKLTVAEISNQTILVVTAFADKDDVKDEAMVWEHQVKELFHRIGS
ncbi:START-like domain-containing protein [Haoranjiania flava]|uniref:START-like domain-containing protein n=1 Tax=Haoranjiania flava TaxID=1856322 RepID=A0AAE3IM07_9BACT|nr:START-like domain-containing protein [Haoranjiania flava]MCU7693440.1 START-like domain-containing protein [Haoranjiania flava]